LPVGRGGALVVVIPRLPTRASLELRLAEGELKVNILEGRPLAVTSEKGTRASPRISTTRCAGEPGHAQVLPSMIVPAVPARCSAMAASAGAGVRSRTWSPDARETNSSTLASARTLPRPTTTT